MSNGFAAGSLVKARGREWVVLPSPEDDLVMVRPLGGADHEETGIVTSLETVEPASFAPPDPETDLGDHRSAKLLRDALRLGFRSSAGPLRCAARIAVDPRPYQLVPLLMALRLDPVRLLIADDVGVGKTIEAALVASELIEQGDARRLAVLCPPHLAEQWQAELAQKFHLDATLVLASTAARLERDLAPGQSLFERHDRVIVSLDYIKSDRRRHDFIRACPELVIVDEAHTCAASGAPGAARHQRHALVKALAADPERHLILVTATPHSGKEGAFRSLLGLIDPDFENLPDDLGGEANRAHRERLARHLVQRRRADITRYLQTDTSFPDRADAEETYRLTPEYAALFDDVLRYARAEVRDPGAARHRQRVRWWSALGLLRALASSPAAAAATMRTRAVTADAETAEEADEIGRARVLDLDDPEEGADVVPGADTEAAAGAVSRKLRDLAARADELRGGADAKLAGLVGIVKDMLEDGFCPIVFCRFIETAVYVGEELARRLPKKLGASVETVTGLLPPGEREARVAELARRDRRVLVATDCLSEGINLQDPFSAVVHYDLPWNPTRLEQREGRVDRFGQRAAQVRVATYYCADNHIDETVLEILLHKHRAIRKALGISIPVPGSTSDVIDALAENVLLSAETSITQRLPGLDEQLRPAAGRLNREWDAARDRESSRRSLFQQSTIHPDEVSAELDAVRAAIGSGAVVADFTLAALTAHGAGVSRWQQSPDNWVIDLAETPPEVRDALGDLAAEAEADGTGTGGRVRVRFEQPGETGVTVLERTHPAVAGLAGFVLDTALDPLLDGRAKRCAAIRTAAVARLTTLLVCRFRFNLVATVGGAEHPMLAEEAGLLAFGGAPERPDWIDDPGQVESLLEAEPSASLNPETSRRQVSDVLEASEHWQGRVAAAARERAEATAEAHQRVRDTARRRFGPAGRLRVTPQLPPDIVGLYVFVPDVAAGAGAGPR